MHLHLHNTHSHPYPRSFQRYELLGTVPHDASCFTQGLALHEGVMYESCGLNGHSSLRVVERATGKVLRTNPQVRHSVFVFLPLPLSLAVYIRVYLCVSV